MIDRPTITELAADAGIDIRQCVVMDHAMIAPNRDGGIFQWNGSEWMRLAPVAKPLSARDLETLRSLAVMTDWCLPSALGGRNNSHHAYTLSKLVDRGLCERQKYGGTRKRGAYRYRINAGGRKAVDGGKLTPP